MEEPSRSRERGRIVEPPRGPRFALRFEDGRGVLALAHPLPFALGAVESLELALGPLRFPLDLRFGAARFRTRRTRVRAASIRLDLHALLAHRVEPPYRLAALAPSGTDGLTWALTDPFGTVAFDARVLAEGQDLWLAIEGARSGGTGPAPPLVRVLAGARALGLELDETRGALRIASPLSSALMEALVPHGWRMPDDRAVRVAVRVLGRRRIAIGTLAEGEPDPLVDPAPWERARRLAPIALALRRGEREAAQQAGALLRERLGALPDPLAREVDALAERVSAEDSPLARTVALRAAITAGNAESAALHARALAALEPCDAVAVEALCAASDLAPDPAAAAALLELARARRPRDARLALRLIEALARLPDDEALRAAVGSALDGREPGIARGELARDAALICELAQRDAEAARLFRLAASSLPSDPRVLEGLARAEERAERHDGALRLWDRVADALADDPEDDEAAARALARAARAAERLGRLDVAEERLARAAARGPEEATVWAALARVRRAGAGPKAALRAEDGLLESAEGLAAGSASREVADALVTAARGALDAGELARARSFLDALTRVSGESVPEPLRAELEARQPRAEAERDTDPAGHGALSAGVGMPSRSGVTHVLEERGGTVLVGGAAAGEGSSLARARTAALARDTAGLRAALRAAEREGDLASARSIVALALEVVGEGPARRALEAARDRLR